MYSLPEKFIERMKKQLPESEWQEFFSVYGNNAFHKGIRVNTLKITSERFSEISNLCKEPVPWAEDAFYCTEEKVGANPYHFAGAFYSQEPSAMSAAPLLEVKPYEKVLDLCSAPGGKGTQLAQKLEGKGLIVLNEPIFSRAKILLENVQRMGVRNAIVLSAYPEKLADVFGNYFDKILVDAPCSGEGMFRKNAKEESVEWSEENVTLCAERQREILSNALKMLKSGGRIVYSTCTFSEEEDELQVQNLLLDHPELTLIKQEKFYPHKVRGEGHFVALFEKGGDNINSYVKQVKASVTSGTQKEYRDFEKKFLNIKFNDLYEKDGKLYSLPENCPDWKNIQTLRVGLYLGDNVNGRFEPSHALALALTPNECKNVVDLPFCDERVNKFLKGESIESEETNNGWCIVCVDGLSIGFGKCVNGTVKNHIPKSLRKMSND